MVVLYPAFSTPFSPPLLGILSLDQRLKRKKHHFSKAVCGEPIPTELGPRMSNCLCANASSDNASHQTLFG